MFAESHHSAHVDAWLKETASGLPPEKLLRLFEQAFHALWLRSHVPLGEVTLVAIVARVLHVAAESYSPLSSLRVEAGGIRWAGLHESAGSLEPEELLDGLRLVLVGFLTVLGNLTAEILTPALHSELSKVRLQGESGPGEGQSSLPGAGKPKETRG